MKKLLTFFGLCLGAMSCAVHAAAPVCYTYAATSYALSGAATGIGTTGPAACADLKAKKSTYSTSTYTFTWYDDGVAGETTTYFRCNYHVTQTRISTGVTTNFGSATWADGTKTVSMCPADPCDALEGLPTSMGGTGAKPSTSCQTDNDDAGGEGGGGGANCEVTLKGASMSTGSGWYSQGTYSGYTGACGSEEPPDSASPNCESSSGGTVCITKGTDPTKQSCGTVNGEAVCLKNVPEGSCLLMKSGGAVCSDGADGAPTDSVGDPATPNKQVELQDGEGGSQTFNYYGPTTVNNSSTTVSGSSGGSGGDGDTSPQSNDDDDEEEQCEGVEDCVGGLGPLEGVEGATAAYIGRIQGSPLVSAVSGIGSSIPDGECPVPSFNAFGRELTLSAMCDVVEPVLPIISAVMLFVWAVFGARILMSA